ncbi:putative NAD-specific glutamate dehydrogenase [Achromobacter insuavis AXX-A]|uniref:Putative NAD-specific glutamate dehydrogenase n=1 Tax=Achromobacter insuavis AXX-A TaxID=1003200 RepID=F7T2P7_9BURK|nr:putative NAD-specific glutamate dehydrogenase [Achromobacter insuavis AXX-A]
MIFLGVGLGILDHALDLVFRQTRVGLDGDLVFLAGALVLGRHVQDAVGVDVERDFDLRHATRRRRDPFEVELAQGLVARGNFTLALEHLDRHGRLVVVGGREGLREAGRDGRVLLDHLGHHAAQGFNTQGQGGDVQQQHVLAIARQHGTLDGGASGDGFVGVHVLARILAEEFLHLFLDLGHAGHAADQDHVVDVGNLHAGVLDGHAAGFDGAFDQFLDQRFQLGARDLQVQVLRTRGVGRDVRQVDLGLLRRRQFDLGLFSGFLQALQGQHVLGQINALFLLELGDDVVDDALVEVFAAQEGVAVGRQHFELLFAIDVGDFDDRDVERAAAQVIHGDLAVALFGLVQAEGQRGRGRLVDDALDFQAGDAAGVLGGLALAVVEVRRHRDDGLGHFLAQVVLGGLLHLAQHVGRHLGRRHLLAAHFHPGVAVVGLDDGIGHQVDVLLHRLFLELAADQALHRVQRVARVGHGLALGGRANQRLAVVHVGDDRRGGAGAFGVFDDLDLTAVHDSHAAVGRAQVDANNFAHGRVTLDKSVKLERNFLSPHNWGCPQGFSRRQAGIFRRRFLQAPDRRRELGQSGPTGDAAKPFSGPVKHKSGDAMQGKAAAQRLVGVHIRLEPAQPQAQQGFLVQQRRLLEEIAVIAILAPQEHAAQVRSRRLDHGGVESRGIDMTHAEHREDLGRVEPGIGHGAPSAQPWPADTTTRAGRSVRSAMA